MTANPAQIVVTAVDVTGQAVPCLHAHHRDFPEIRADGETARAAAVKLGEQLRQAHEAVSDTWHRASIEQAIEDLRAFVARPN